MNQKYGINNEALKTTIVSSACVYISGMQLVYQISHYIYTDKVFTPFSRKRHTANIYDVSVRMVWHSKVVKEDNLKPINRRIG